MSNTRNDIAKRLGLAQPKTKMGRAEKVMTDGSVHLDFKEAKEWLSSVSDDSLKYIISDANAAAKAMGADGKKFNYYTDLALTAGQILRSTKRGGHRLNNAYPGPRRATSEAARSIAADLEATYGIQAWVEDAIVFVDAKNFERAKQARAEQNKKHYNPRIALRAVSSRPGAKAKFAKWEVTPTKKNGVPIEEHTAKIGIDLWKIDTMPHAGVGVGSLYRWDKLRGLRLVSTGQVDLLKKQAEAISTKKDAISDLMRGFSRPGAKVKMAANNVDLWNYFANLDFNFVKQGENGLANYERFAKKALTMPDFTPPSERGNGPSLHQMAKQALADIKKYKEDLYRYKNRAPWDVYSRFGAKGV